VSLPKAFRVTMSVCVSRRPPRGSAFRVRVHPRRSDVLDRRFAKIHGSSRCGPDESPAELLGELFWFQVTSEGDDPGRELGVGGVDAVSVGFEEGQHRDEGESFVPVEECLALGDAVCEDRCLQGDIGTFVAGVRRRTCECSLER
jgi:hypothetical protein